MNVLRSTALSVSLGWFGFIGAQVQSVEVPAGQREVLRAEGRGVQIYRCDAQTDGKSAKWTFVAPEAKLSLNAAEVGSHGAGPMWRYRDGSAVWGEILTKAPSPNAESIPVLLLKAVKTEGSGILSGVSYIERADTRGGNAPALGCDAEHIGRESRVEYSAIYVFYAPATK